MKWKIFSPYKFVSKYFKVNITQYYQFFENHPTKNTHIYFTNIIFLTFQLYKVVKYHYQKRNLKIMDVLFVFYSCLREFMKIINKCFMDTKFTCYLSTYEEKMDVQLSRLDHGS